MEVKKYMTVETITYCEIIAGRNTIMLSTAFSKPFKDLKLDPTAKLFVHYDLDYGVLVLRTDKVIKNLFIGSTFKYIKLSDNYFDMIPNKIYKVSLMGSHNG